MRMPFLLSVRIVCSKKTCFSIDVRPVHKTHTMAKTEILTSSLFFLPLSTHTFATWMFLTCSCFFYKRRRNRCSAEEAPGADAYGPWHGNPRLIRVWCFGESRRHIPILVTAACFSLCDGKDLDRKKVTPAFIRSHKGEALKDMAERNKGGHQSGIHHAFK